MRITKTNRGFHKYGTPVRCTYRSMIRVYESSSASGPHVWLNIVCDPTVLRDEPSGEGTAHLNERQARAVVARLQAWLDEIPARWGKKPMTAPPASPEPRPGWTHFDDYDERQSLASKILEAAERLREIGEAWNRGDTDAKEMYRCGCSLLAALSSLPRPGAEEKP